MVTSVSSPSHTRILTFFATDVNHDMAKTRLAKDGTVISAPKMKELKGDLERIAATKAEGGTCMTHVYFRHSTDILRPVCLSCFGGTPPTDGPNPGCCNSCEDVREAYVRRGWSFVNPDAVEQVRISPALHFDRVSSQFITVCE